MATDTRRTKSTALTGREDNVESCLILGRNLQQTADDLRLSVNTVKTHAKRIFKKREVRSHLQLVSLARAARGCRCLELDPEFSQQRAIALLREMVSLCSKIGCRCSIPSDVCCTYAKARWFIERQPSVEHSNE